jgi:hypothetical protein
VFEGGAPQLTVLDALEQPASVAYAASVGQPGPQSLALLSAVDPDRLSPAEKIDLLVAYERHAAWLAACQSRVLASIAKSGPRHEDDWVCDEVAAALRLSVAAAGRRLDFAESLATRLPGTWKMLADGEITFLHALAIHDAISGLSDEVVAAVEARVLPAAPRQTLAQFKRSVRRAVIAADPRTAQERHVYAAQARQVTMTPLEDGMAEISAVTTAEGAATVMTALSSLALRHRVAGDERTIDQRRADALVDLCAGALAGAELPTRHGRRPDIQVTLTLQTLLGLDEEPAELAGYGPITAANARRIAAAGEWRALLVDDRGALLDYGRTTYRPPRDLSDFVIARDRVCAFPGCGLAAERCDIDHQVPFDAGGSTSARNLHPLCRHHHRLKHEAGWTVTANADGSFTWRSPNGHTYLSVTPPYPVGGGFP